MAKAARAVVDGAVPRSAASCACGGVCPSCKTENSSSLAPSGASVRLHPSAPEITGPLRARAVTIGQDIYFHPGEYRPNTPQGENLIAHELAHTRQTRRSSVALPGERSSLVSRPGDALEKNAEALASGATTAVLAAPAGAVLRTPFDQESSGDHARRQELLQSIHNAQANLLRLLQTGGLIANTELAVERGGVQGVVVPANTAGADDESFVSYATRDVQLRRMIRNLAAMGTLYRTAPIPAGLPASEADDDGSFSTRVERPDGNGSIYSGLSDAWAQLQGAYELYRYSAGQVGEEFSRDWYYLKPNLRIVPGAARGAPRIGRGTQSGAYMVFPDINDEPLHYWMLDGFTAAPAGSTIVEFWHDELGYYYLHGNQRIDVPSPWTHPRGNP